MAHVISKYWLYMEIFNIGRHYFSQTDIEVDIWYLVHIHWKNKCLAPTERSFTLSKFPTYFIRVPTVLEKSLNFGFSLKSPWKWICPWKVLEFRVPSLKFQLVVLDFLLCVFWTESLNGYSKLRGTRANFFPKKFARFARSSLQVKYFSTSSCSYIILEQFLSYPSFLKNTYRYWLLEKSYPGEIVPKRNRTQIEWVRFLWKNRTLGMISPEISYPGYDFSRDIVPW